MNRIFWAGDSTVQTNDYTTYPQCGIGQAFSIYIRPEYSVLNYARNGRSTKSFIDEGRLAAIEKEIGKDDFLFIQFGHNDEKIQDASRFTEPHTSFIDNLEIFIKTARDHGALPVLITPLERRCFVDEHHLGPGEHLEYVKGMREAAEKFHVSLIDLYRKSRRELEKVGEERSRGWYMYFPAGYYPEHPEEKRDNTHLRHDGACHFAGLIAEGLKELGGVYAQMLLDERGLYSDSDGK